MLGCTVDIAAQSDDTEYMAVDDKTETVNNEAEYEDAAIYRDSIYGVSGTIVLHDAHATLETPEGYIFINKEMAEYLTTEYWNYDYDDSMIGALVPEDAHIYYNVDYALFLYNYTTGYVDDTDASDFNAEEYKKIVVSTDDSSFITRGWIIDPQYNTSRHMLELCRQTERHSQVDDNGEYTIAETFTYYLYIYNRLGYLHIGTHADIDRLDQIMVARKELINSITFDKGYRYIDFDESTDERDVYTIGSSSNPLFSNDDNSQDDTDVIESDDDFELSKTAKYIIIGILTIVLTLLFIRLAEMMSYRDNDRRRE